MGGDLNAFTSEDHTCYFAKADARQLARVADVLLDMYAHSTLPAAEVERERGVIREEILMGKDQPSQVADELLAREFWPGHALGRPLTGTEESLAGITRDDLLAFWRAHYGGRNTVFTVSGPVVHAEVAACLGPALGRLPAGRRAPRAKAPDGFGLPGVNGRNGKRGRGGLRVAGVRQDSEQVQLALGFPAPHRWDPRRFAARTLNVILGDNMSSRLFQLLRERRGLCYSVQTTADSFQDSGLFGIYVGLDAGRVVETLRLIGRELRRISDHAPSAAEMRRARDYLIGQHRIALDEGTTSQMNWMGECLLAYDRVAEPAEAREKLAAVTADEVRALAHAAFVEGGHAALAAVGPLDCSDEEMHDSLTGPLG